MGASVKEWMRAKIKGLHDEAYKLSRRTLQYSIAKLMIWWAMLRLLKFALSGLSTSNILPHILDLGQYFYRLLCGNYSKLVNAIRYF